MANRYRGEISATFDGKTYPLCLTLGALAELETAFGAEDMVALATRFENGRISARDAQRIIAAGLRGGGRDITDEDVADMKTEGGAAGYIDIVARLLRATFTGTETHTQDAAQNSAGQNVRSTNTPSLEGGATVPFPGTT